MSRLWWFTLAVVLALGGWELLLREILGWSGWLVIGIGCGIGCAVIGSLAHDALAGPRERFR